ncbi:MAG: hypothetical protein Q9218_006196 [Villophora microphyllina]
MSVQTRVMVDGRWTTRNLDIHEILARNREERQDMPEASVVVKPPVVGLWTRTVVRSPVIKAIVPARVRHRSKNDVVFVYEDRIIIKEILGGERIEQDPFSDISLDDVIVKSDFDSSIQAAKILGLKRKSKASRFPGKYWGAANDRPPSPPETKPEPFHENEVPPQILVLSLTSRMLVFLFAYHDTFGAVHFLSNTWPLPAQMSTVEELGVHLAVDPRSRAMAVGACENRVVLYALKGMDEIRQEVQIAGQLNKNQFMPIREERHTEVDGIILKMEFLHPTEGEDYRVILLLVVAKDQKTRLVRFEWDCRSGLRSVEKKPAQVLPHAEQFPLLLIPLTYESSFALVCEDQLVVYKGILTGSAVGQRCQLGHAEPPEEAGGSKILPIWTQWARPMRIEERSRPIMDNIYLCREDGVVRYIDIRKDANPMISSNYNAGVLQANLGSAFAVLDLGDESNDLLVAAGEMGDGGMWYFAPRQTLDLVGSIRNWTPLESMVTVATPPPPSNEVSMRETSTFESTTRLFACSGQGSRYGAVTEIRVGTEAVKLGPDIDLGELAHNGVVNMWALPDRSNAGIYLMVAHPTDTELILLPSSSDEDPRAISEHEVFDLDVKSIAAGSTAEGFLIQVTETSINAIAQEHGILPFSSKFDGTIITNACFLTIPARTTALLFVMRREDGFYLHHGHFGLQDGQIAFELLGESTPLQSEVSAVAMDWIDGQVVAFIGTLAGTVQNYIDDSGSSFVPDHVYYFNNESSICDSLATIKFEQTDDECSDSHLLVCGLRDGTVQSLFFNRDKSRHSGLGLCEELHIGTTSVMVISDATRESRALLVCGQALYTLKYSGIPSTTNPAVVTKVWLTDPGLSGFQQRPLDCFTQASARIPHGYSQYGAGSLFCLSGSILLLADLSSSPEPAMVPRHLRVNGTPTSITYSGALDRIMLIYTTTTSQPHGRLRKAAAQPAISFIRPDAEFPRSNSNDQDKLKNVLSAADMDPEEYIIGGMDWFPTDGIKSYHMIVVWTRNEPSANRKIGGRLLLFTPSMNNAGEVELTLKRSMAREGPLSSVIAYSDSSLIYGCGDDLVLQTLDMSTRKFGSAFKASLRSPVSQLSVQETDLHVSTLSSGHHIFRIEKDRLVPKFAGASARAGTRHLCRPESLVITSDLECRIAGLWQPPQPQLDRTAPTMFEAVLPRSVTSLCQIERPVWQNKFPAVIGSCDDGTIYELIVLKEHIWKLLAFIQNMVMREPSICPCPHPIVFERHLEPSSTKYQDMHIDGDILARFIERGGASLLAEMLHRSPDPRKKYADYATADDRSQRFQAIARAVFPDYTIGCSDISDIRKATLDQEM